MELTQLLNSVKAIQVIGEVQRKDIAGIVYDSRKVKENCVFVAIKGYTFDGHKFILDAINNGAIAIVLEDNNYPDDIFIHRKVAKILVINSRSALAELSSAFYKNPSTKLKLIGVTGTNGKTTTAFFIKNIFETAGEKVGLIGTIANYIGNREIPTKLTTPESNDLNSLFHDMVNENCDTAVMEVSSHSLALKRVEHLHFKEAIFTNITSDHLDFHGSFENYFNAKKILFDSLPEGSIAIYNSDDVNGKRIVDSTIAKIYSYGVTPEQDFTIKDIEYDLNGTRFNIVHKKIEYPVSTSLIGEFNAYNACAAFASAILMGVDFKTAIMGIENTKQVPGRFEVIGQGSKKAIVDYSHTADSLEKTLMALNKIVKSSKPIYTVFGCGGDRDRTKRPIMGRIASELSHKIFITSDNPRNEDPFSIIAEIKKGAVKNNYSVIEDRAEAIRTAIETSEENAVILIAGKGHENYQEIKGVRHHLSDKEIAEKYL